MAGKDLVFKDPEGRVIMTIPAGDPQYDRYAREWQATEESNAKIRAANPNSIENFERRMGAHNHLVDKTSQYVGNTATGLNRVGGLSNLPSGMSAGDYLASHRPDLSGHGNSSGYQTELRSSSQRHGGAYGGHTHHDYTRPTTSLANNFKREGGHLVFTPPDEVIDANVILTSNDPPKLFIDRSKKGRDYVHIRMTDNSSKDYGYDILAKDLQNAHFKDVAIKIGSGLGGQKLNMTFENASSLEIHHTSLNAINKNGLIKNSNEAWLHANAEGEAKTNGQIESLKKVNIKRHAQHAEVSKVSLDNIKLDLEDALSAYASNKNANPVERMQAARVVAAMECNNPGMVGIHCGKKRGNAILMNMAASMVATLPPGYLPGSSNVAVRGPGSGPAVLQ